MPKPKPKLKPKPKPKPKSKPKSKPKPKPKPAGLSLHCAPSKDRRSSLDDASTLPRDGQWAPGPAPHESIEAYSPRELATPSSD